MVFLSTGKMGFFPTGNMEINGPVKITNTTASTSPYTGSLTVAGGVGITGSINVLASGGPTLDTDGSTQAVITGPDCAGQLGNLAIISNSPAADGAGGSIAFAGQFSGGSVASFAKIKGYRIGGSYTGRMALQTRDSGGSMLTAMLISEVQNVSIPTTTSSSSPTTGALTVAGGVGVGGALNAAAVVGGGSGVWSVNSVNTGVYEFGSDGHQYLQFDGSTFRFVGGSVYVPVPSVNMGITLGRGGSYAYANSNAAGVSLLQDSSFFEGTGSQNNTVMHVNRISSNGPVVVFDQTGTIVGSISVTTTATAYNTSSDLRLKEDLKSFDAGNIIDKTEVYDFKWKSVDERSYGVIAQQAKEIYPTAVAYDEHNDWWGIDYSKYVPVLLQELKALRLRVAQLEAKVNQ
jgi:hypothetical protein